METSLTGVCDRDQPLGWLAVLLGFAVLFLARVDVGDDDSRDPQLLDEWLESVGMTPSDIKEGHISTVQLLEISLHEKRDEHALSNA
ncbi:hypothetical protein IQA72_17665, partial [Leptospira borgpetersenii serovar Ballum]|nr:hypothetical protein [Leptospira borgpetersenii serovar Ballum]